MVGWNLARFTETLLPLLHEDQNQAIEIAQEEISEFPKLCHANWLAGMRSKLGIFNVEKEAESLIEDLMKMMKKHSADYTNTFRALTFEKREDTVAKNLIWNERWKTRLSGQQESKDDSQELMRNSNPALIPRIIGWKKHSNPRTHMECDNQQF